MQINKTSDTAIALIVALARSEDTVVNSHALSDRVGCSYHYTQQIMGKLRDQGIIGVKRGPSNSGYYLCRPVEEISLYDVIAPFEKSMQIDSALSGDSTLREEPQVTEFWDETQKIVDQKLKETSVQDLLDD
ncbi:MAG: Rrf2 family transcriptional regulator [Clostridia bacterium]|nr:Rrf2 family transcriptional regulator [Clostridia bacterium]